MATDRTVEVTLKANVASYKASMSQAAASTAQLSAAQATAAKKMAASNAKITASAATMGRVGTAGAVAIGAALVVSVKNASTLEEAISKTNNVFKASGVVVQNWSKGLAKDFGLSRQEALASVSQFGDMYLQMGLGADKAVEMSQAMVELTADMGSFHDLESAEVQTKIASAMRGEYEAIRSIVPALSGKRVAEEAMIATGKKSVTQLTAQDKAMATYQILMKDTASAQGDFARTSDGMANSTKTMKAELTDASAELGTSLIPMATSVVELLTKVTRGFSDLTEAQKKWAVGGALVGVVLLKMAPRIAAQIVAHRLQAASLNQLTAATIANTTATRANSTATGANAAAKTGAAAATGSATAATGALGGATMGLTAILSIATLGIAATAAGAYGAAEASNRFGKEWGILAGVVTMNPFAIISAGASDGKEKLNAVNSELVAQRQYLNELVAAGDMQRLESAMASLQEQYGEGFDDFIQTTSPEVQEAVAGIGQAQKDAAEASAQLADKQAQVAKQFRWSGDNAMKYARELVNVATTAGKSTVEIREMLKAAGVPPKKIRLLVDISQAEAELVKAQESINELRQYRKPKVEASVELLDKAMANSQKRLDSLKQSKKPDIGVDIEDAKYQVRAIQHLIDQIKGGNVNIDINRIIHTQTETSATLVKWAEGGVVHGSGTGTSDSIPAMLSNGEYVIKASSARRIGYSRLDELNSGVQRFAKGGKAKKKAEKKSARQQAKQDAYNERFANWGETSRGQSQYLRGETASQGRGTLSFDFGQAASTMGAYTSAVADQTRAQDNLFAARQRVNRAKLADKPEALRAMAQAQRELAAATEGVASAERDKAASAPTAANILSNYQGRVAKMQTWASNMSTLRSWGLPSSLAGEILDSGLESGSAMAAALIAGGAGNMGSFQSSAASLAGATGSLAGESLYSTFNSDGVSLYDEEKIAAAAVGQDPAAARAARAAAAAAAAAKKKKKKKKRGKRALGGDVWAGQEYIVGEQGHELFVPGVNGSIMSNASLMSGRAMAGAGVGGSSAPVSISMDGNAIWQGLVTHNRRTGFTIREL